MTSAPSERATLVGRPVRVPGLVVDVELSRPARAIEARDAAGRRRERVWAVVRLFTEPLGLVVVDVPDEGLSAAALVRHAVEYCRAELAPRLAAVGLSLEALGPDGVALSTIPPFLEVRTEVLAAAPACTVVVCTRERPDDLRRCLESVAAQRYPAFDVLVVDNAPVDDGSRRVVEGFASRLNVRYAVEPRPGLSRARNHALAQIADGIVAWLDDDEMADPHWLAELARGFHLHPEAAAVSGAVVPAEMETVAQVWFEQFGGHSKGRGFTPALFSPATARQQSPLYPLPPFGVGANMAFRAEALRGIGGFDEALGAGTPAKGAEDTAVFTRLLRSGATTVYQPSALTRHVHRRDLAGLRAQMHGYGAGLTAFYTSLLVQEPGVVWPLLRLLPTALRDLTSAGSPRVAAIDDDFPRELLRVNVRGMLVGPWRYLLGRRRRSR
jgi:GT2 family glycosyltransferase